MLAPEAIIAAFPNEEIRRACVQRAKDEGGIEQGDKDSWISLHKHVVDSQQFAYSDIDEFMTHLRILADHYLMRAWGERNLPKFVMGCKSIQESQKDTLEHAKELLKRLKWDRVKSALPDGGATLIAALDDAIGNLQNELQRPLPVSKRNPVRHGNHALVQTFEAIWNLYAIKNLAGNKSAYAIAGWFFIWCGYLPRGTNSAVHSDIPQLFDKARIQTKNLGPLTTVRRMSVDEKRVFTDLFFLG